MAIENSITFGGVNSADFGIYISGEGVFNAPQRDVEMIEIPGRNGEFALDNGRFKNIEVSYPAFNFEPDDYDSFVQNLSDFRNAICAQRGYQRLTDTFHPDEYRMATYIGGLEIKPIKYNTASEFNIVFNCKPQRWLTSGETAVSVDTGDVLTNPTQFESSPLLEVNGYGTIGFNGYEIELENTVLGEINVADASITVERTINIDTSNLEQGDEIYCDQSAQHFINFQVTITAAEGYTFYKSGEYFTERIVTGIHPSGDDITDWTFNYGTAVDYSYKGCSPSASDMVYTTSNTYVGIYSCSFYAKLSYDGNETITATYWINKSTLPETFNVSTPITYWSSIKANSTKTLGTVYIDCDMGEAYTLSESSFVSLNRYIDLGSDLPTLAVGENNVTFDNTITDLQIVPRWWKV